MSSVFQIGIAGAGSVVDHYHLPVLSSMDQVEVKWICDLNRERAIELSRAYGVPKTYRDLQECPDVDVVLVAIPVGYRRGPLELMFERHWHVFCEKPFATSRDMHDWITRRASEQGVQVGVGMMRRFYDATEFAQELIGSGTFGLIDYLRASEGVRQRGTGREDGWYQANVKAAGGGVLIEQGCHLIDQVFTICGVEDSTLEGCSFDYRGDIDYAARISGRMKMGGRKTCGFSLEVSKVEDLYSGISVKFKDAMVRIELGPAGRLFLCENNGRTLATLSDPRRKAINHSVYAAFYKEWREFLTQCHTSKPSRINAESARLTTSLIEACYKSAPPSGATRI